MKKKGVIAVANKKLEYVKQTQIKKVLSGCDWLLLLGERSNGKSYAAKSLILKECYKNDTEFIYLRRYDLDIKDSQCVLYFADCPVETITDGEYSSVDVYRKSIYFANTDPETGKVVRGKKIGYCQCLSGAEHYKSFAFPKVKYVLFEEFVSASGRYLFNEATSVLPNHVSTIFRNHKGKVILIGNTISRICPYYREWKLNVGKQALGTVEKYKYTNDNGDDTRLSVYLTDSLNANSGMFFGNVAKSITKGAYEVQEMPHIPKSPSQYNKLYTIVVEYNEFKFLCELMQDREELNNVFWYVQPKTTEIQKGTRVISNQFSTDPLYTSGFNRVLSANERQALSLFDSGKTCFSDNLTGTEFNTILEYFD